MVRKLEEYLRIFEENDFHDVVLAAKSLDPTIVIDAYREISRRFDFPLHLGVTHAGPPETGRIRSIAALGTLLAEGIGDTIRISYAADPIHEVEDGKELLCCLGLRQRTEPELIACPTCGRIEVDLITLVQQVRERLAVDQGADQGRGHGLRRQRPRRGRRGRRGRLRRQGQGVIYVQGEQVRTVTESEMLDALYQKAQFRARNDRSAFAQTDSCGSPRHAASP